MAIAEITPLGFYRERLIGIKADLDARVTDKLGPVNTGPDAVVGQYNAAISEAIDLILETLEDAYFSMYPASASGTSLDGAVSFVGIERISASYTQVIATCYGADSTLIPLGSIAASITNAQYRTKADAIISRSAVTDVTVSIQAVANNTLYQVTMGPHVLSYTSGSGATSDSILAGLAASASNITAVVDGQKLRVTSADRQTGYAFTTTANIKVERIGSPVLFVADDLGVNPLPVGALTKVVTSVAGWDAVENLASANEGRDAETDSALRARHAIGVRAVGSATVAAIRARLLQEVEGVTGVSVYENRTGVSTVAGMPPHSIECVVEGGLDLAVAQKIFDAKAAGIETFGNVTQYITDSNGDAQNVSFSRPVARYIWLKISGTRYAEETLPTEYKAAIRTAALAHGTSLGVGEDVILQRFYGPIFDAVPGIASLVVQAAVTAGESDTPTYGASNIPVSRSEVAKFAVARITVEDF